MFHFNYDMQTYPKQVIIALGHNVVLNLVIALELLM